MILKQKKCLHLKEDMSLTQSAVIYLGWLWHAN